MKKAFHRRSMPDAYIKEMLFTTPTSDGSSNNKNPPYSSLDSDLFYKPGEMPKLKYRGPVDKEHKRRLHAFSFPTSFPNPARRRSGQSLYSPYGTRLSSRRGSVLTISHSEGPSRQVSQVEFEDDLGDVSSEDEVAEIAIARG